LNTSAVRQRINFLQQRFTPLLRAHIKETQRKTPLLRDDVRELKSKRELRIKLNGIGESVFREDVPEVDVLLLVMRVS
jgi:hypothetical protein